METCEDIDRYLKVLPAEQREALQQLRETIAGIVPNAVEAISYGMPAFKLGGRPLVGFSAAKGHLAFHPMSGTVVAAQGELLDAWSTSKGTVRFQPDHPLTLSVITTLITARMQELGESTKGTHVPAPKPAATKSVATKAPVTKSAATKAATPKAASPTKAPTPKKPTKAAGGSGLVFATTLVQAEGMKATGIVVPPEVIEALGAGKKPPVSVTINGYNFRTTVGVMGGNAMIGVSADTRKATGLSAGDEIEVSVEVADAPREVVVPTDFAAALKAQPAAASFFAKLSNSLQRFHIDNINGAKTDDTRARRIEKSVQLFLDGKQR